MFFRDGNTVLKTVSLYRYPEPNTREINNAQEEITMDMQFTNYSRPRMADFMAMPAHNTVRNERERLDSVTQLVSTITLVAQSIDSAYRRDTVEGDRLVECIVELSRRALSEVRAWPTRSTGAGYDPTSMISHALSRAMGPVSHSLATVPLPTEPDLGAVHDLVEGRKRLASLTAREHDMLKLIMQGMSNKEIANTLHLTEGTVKGYVSHMLSKIGVSDRTQAALFAVKHGLEG